MHMSCIKLQVTRRCEPRSPHFSAINRHPHGDLNTGKCMSLIHRICGYTLLKSTKAAITTMLWL